MQTADSTPLHFQCPSCACELVRTDTGVGLLWACPGCQGRAVSLSFLRRGVENQFLNEVWQQARNNAVAKQIGPRACPSCANKMPVAILPVENAEPLVLDVCPTCHFLWLDHGEAAQMPVRPAETRSGPAELSPEAKEAVALAQVEALARRAEMADGVDTFHPSRPWIVLLDTVLRHLRF